MCSCQLDQFHGVDMCCQVWTLCKAFRKWNGFGDDVVAEQPSHPCLVIHNTMSHVTPCVFHSSESWLKQCAFMECPLSRLKATMIWWAWFVDGMRLWRKAVPLTPVSSNTCFLSAQAQSSVEWSARVHKATLLESAMSLTNVQLRPPSMCGRASVARSTMGRRLLPSGPSHKNCVMFFSNRHSARVGAGAAETTWSTVGRIMVRTMSARLWMDRFLLLHALSLVSALASAFSQWCHIWVTRDDGTQVMHLVLWSQNRARNHIWWWWVLRHAATQE